MPVRFIKNSDNNLKIVQRAGYLTGSFLYLSGLKHFINDDMKSCTTF